MARSEDPESNAVGICCTDRRQARRHQSLSSRGIQLIARNNIRPTAIGKKNWLFIGNAQAGERSAILYTLIECCRRRGLDPFAYLRDVFTRLPSMTNRQIQQLTPEAWAKARRAEQRAAA